MKVTVEGEQTLKNKCTWVGRAAQVARHLPSKPVTFFKNVAAVSLFVAVIRFTPSGDWTRIIYCK
jgi:hypothetical protein